MKIKYVFKHKGDEDIQTEIFLLDEIEKGETVLDFIGGMKTDGYKLINRYFVEY